MIQWGNYHIRVLLQEAQEHLGEQISIGNNFH